MGKVNQKIKGIKLESCRDLSFSDQLGKLDKKFNQVEE